MKHIGIKCSILFTCIFAFGCSGEKIRKENIINTVKSTAIQLPKEANEVIPFDSVYVTKKTNNKDSLSFYKKTKLVGSAVIEYEE